MNKKTILAQLTLILVLASFIHSNITSTITAGDRVPARKIRHAIYFSPDSADSTVKPEIIHKFEMKVIKKQKDLEEYITSRKDVSAIYIHPSKKSEINTKWLKKQYKDGIAIILINSPMSDLVHLLEENQYVYENDLHANQILISMAYHFSSDSAGDIGQYSDYHSNFDNVPLLLDMRLDSSVK